MSPRVSPRAGQPAQPSDRLDVAHLLAEYFSRHPDPAIPEQRVSFGTSGHRGSSLRTNFNEDHVLVISQAICLYRQLRNITGPLFVGIDTHALSAPALETVLEVFAANNVDVMIAGRDEYTPTPAVSHAILAYNRGRMAALADGIVLTPSHNPPEDGGYKYNPPHGGPAEAAVTNWIEAKANALLENRLKEVKRIPIRQARNAATTHAYDYLDAYVSDLANVIDLEAIRGSSLHMGVDPLGGAGVHYWPRIAEQYGLNLTVISEQTDPTFAFMTLDWDGRIRMDPSSAYAMQRLIGMKARYDIAFACDTDHDRHGIVVPGAGLLPANHYLAVAVDYLFTRRPRWSRQAAVGKTVVSSALIDRVAARLGRVLYEVPVGFKWFVAGLLDGRLAFGGEESAGASFCRLDGSAWTTDKDGMTAALLSAEITACTGRDPGECYRRLVEELGEPMAERVEAPATAEQKRKLARLSPADLHISDLAGEAIDRMLDRAPGNDAPIGGIKIVTGGGWVAARPSGTEDIYKIYAESFRGKAHLHTLMHEAQGVIERVWAKP